MTSREWLVAHEIFPDRDLIKALDEFRARHAAEVIRETLAAWMIKWGYATGHGDTIEELLEELRVSNG